MVGELPNDGRERQMTVTIGGDNHGNITFGNHITIHAAPVAEPEPERAPPSDEQLREMERQAKQQQREAWLRSWCNVPSLVLLGVLAILVAWVIFMGVTSFVVRWHPNSFRRTLSPW